MEEFEIKAINSAPQCPQFWKRFVDDTFTIIESSKKKKNTGFLDHLNNIDEHI